mgnify:CR=1 FL=1
MSLVTTGWLEKNLKNVKIKPNETESKTEIKPKLKRSLFFFNPNKLSLQNDSNTLKMY